MYLECVHELVPGNRIQYLEGCLPQQLHQHEPGMQGCSGRPFLDVPLQE